MSHAKAATERSASAEARITISEDAFSQVMDGTLPKGDVVATARIAGIMAAKKTSEFIPLCHPIALTHAGVEIEPLPDGRTLQIITSAKTTGQTGVEMEALTAASVAALTVYDMVKAVDKSAVIDSIRLLTKIRRQERQLCRRHPTGRSQATCGKTGGSREVKPRVLSDGAGAACSACKQFRGPGNFAPIHDARGLRPRSGRNRPRCHSMSYTAISQGIRADCLRIRSRNLPGRKSDAGRNVVRQRQEMISVDEAVQRIVARFSTLPPETIALTEAAGVCLRASDRQASTSHRVTSPPWTATRCDRPIRGPVQR